MAQSYFIWNGVDCRSLGVKLSGPVPIVFPEERVQHVEIPGRDGDLTETEGADEDDKIYNSYIQTASIMVPGGYRARDIKKWLSGSGEVTFHGEPDRKQKARVIGAITLNKHSHNLDWWVGEVQFYCQPLKQKLSESVNTLSASGTVTNAGDVACYPRILATASASTMSISVNGKTLEITGLTSTNSYYIDSDIMDVLTADETTILTANSSGPVPVLEVGDNVIGGSGWSSLRIERRERFL